jgi:hypothetical protein
VVVAAQAMGLHDGWSLLAGAAVGSGLRVLAMFSGLKLPRWSSAGE